MFSTPCPNLDTTVRTTTSEQLTVRAEGDRLDILGMPSKGLEHLPGVRVPQRYGFVPTATGTRQETPIGAKGDRINIPRFG